MGGWNVGGESLHSSYKSDMSQPEITEAPLEFFVPKRFAGLRMLQFLKLRLPGLGRNTAAKLMAAGKVTIDSETIRKDQILDAGMRVTVLMRQSHSDPAAVDLSLEIIHEDDQLIVLNKPAGEVVTRGRQDESCKLLDAVAHYLESGPDDEIRPRVVHRLDRDTSGVLLIAKTVECKRWLTNQFEEHKVEKKYLAVVHGEIYEDEGKIDLKIKPISKRSNIMKASRSAGRDCLTEFKVAERFFGYTLLEVFPKTGRTHQIRVHMKASGHPLAVDPTYGGHEDLRLSNLKRGYRTTKGRTESPIMDRLSLHAQSIRFVPREGAEPVTYEIDSPDDFNHLLHCLRKYRKKSKPRNDDW